MTPAELKAWRERLGLSTRWLAERWHVRELTVQRWERDRQAPDGVLADMQQLIAAYRIQAATLAATGQKAVEVPRVDSATPDPAWPAAWYRAVALESGKPLTFTPDPDKKP